MHFNPILQCRALWCFVRSLGKRAWALSDYPVRIVHRPAPEPAGPSRLVYMPWTAQVVNWWLMRGDGLTREAATAELERRLAAFAESHPLPRPGIPFRQPIDYAETDEVERLRPFVEDLLSRVLQVDPAECFVSDESSLWDFHGDETNDEYLRRISLLYGVDASHLDPPTLVAIARLVAVSRGRT